jgi:hypothetical protein
MDTVIAGANGLLHETARSPPGAVGPADWLYDKWTIRMPGGETMFFCLMRAPLAASFLIGYGWPRLRCKRSMPITGRIVTLDDFIKIMDTAKEYFTLMHVEAKTVKRISGWICICSLELTHGV